MALTMVRVDWFDAEGQEKWEAHADTLAWGEELPVLATTYGLLVYDSDTHIVVAQTYTDHQVMHSLKIPRGCIKRIEELSLTAFTI